MPLLVLLATSGGALSGETINERYLRHFAEVDELLRAGKWAKAEKVTGRMRDSMFETVVGGGEAWLGLLAAYRAVALAGRGERDQAAWMLRVARQFCPRLEGFDPADYGEPGAWLAHLPPPDLDEAGPDEEPSPSVRPPAAVEQPLPEFPPARALRGRTVSVQVQCVLGTDGVPRHPRIVESEGEFTMVYAALEALGRWRFRPAALDGEPIEVGYVLQVSFSVP